MDSVAKQKLIKLQKAGTVLFHGSGCKIKKLEPKQAYNYPKDSSEEKIPDGLPAVFASLFADVAIFMAIFSKPNVPNGLRSGFVASSDGNNEFRVTKDTMGQISNAKGYVHVLDKKKFIMRTPVEGVSYQPVDPIEVIEVTDNDLPVIIIEDF